MLAANKKREMKSNEILHHIHKIERRHNECRSPVLSRSGLSDNSKKRVTNSIGATILKPVGISQQVKITPSRNFDLSKGSELKQEDSNNCNN